MKGLSHIAELSRWDRARKHLWIKELRHEYYEQVKLFVIWTVMDYGFEFEEEN